jgi:hypothetical protein
MAPFGSCHLQCVANLLAWQDVDSAASGLCPTWGFSWPGGMVLKGSGRWVAAARAAYRIDLEERCYRSFPAARAAEQDAVGRGYPVAATVDAWYVPSPYEGNEHIAHCVLLVGNAPDQVWVVDPMNRPYPVRYPTAEWERMRSAACTGGCRTFLVTSGPRRTPGSTDLIGRLRDDIRAHRARDRRQLEAFLAFRASGDDVPHDVSEVAAERLYLAKLVKRAARDMPGLARLADDLMSLARRWYLAHSLARESAGASEPRGRQLRLLCALADRERAAVERAAALLDALPGLERQNV